MGKIVYSKTIQIKNKVFKEEDIIYLSQIIKDQFAEGDYSREIILLFDDDSQIWSDDIDIFSTEAFKRRQCKSIRFEYASQGYERKLEVDLNNSAIGLDRGNIKIRSTNQVWYESIQKRLEDAIDEVQPQNKISQHPYVLAVVLSILEALLFAITLVNILAPKPAAFASIVFSFLSLGIFLGINMLLTENLKKAYPSIEFAFGPVHRSVSYKRKRIINILVPFLIDVLFFVLGMI